MTPGGKGRTSICCSPPLPAGAATTTEPARVLGVLLALPPLAPPAVVPVISPTPRESRLWLVGLPPMGVPSLLPALDPEELPPGGGVELLPEEDKDAACAAANAAAAAAAAAAALLLVGIIGFGLKPSPDPLLLRGHHTALVRSSYTLGRSIDRQRISTSASGRWIVSWEISASR